MGSLLIAIGRGHLSTSVQVTGAVPGCEQAWWSDVAMTGC